MKAPPHKALPPANLPLFERLGVAGRVSALGMRNWGAEFVSPWHGGRRETTQQGAQVFEGSWGRDVELLRDGIRPIDPERATAG